ncbi:hypothetical protein AYO49_02055 [Verrucomicrobiaceae bacterium SCGC AG-212-N21]|nr:hypothetical protein AYO49_02055 [Verrucomicrobiaceae bacterium SCGC AG-212-N21]
MNTMVIGATFAAGLFIGILVLIRVGRSIGVRRLAADGESASKGFGAVEGAIFGLLGLVLAFLFSGALSRFDARRQLVVEEVNDIGTAWLRIDLLPTGAQPGMRDLFRKYLDSRIATYKKLPDIDAAKSELAESSTLQLEIWELAVSATQGGASAQAPMLLLPALNAMFDITTARTEAARIHPPTVIYVMLGALALACSLFAGYDMATRKHNITLHSLAFALVLSVTVYVIFDLEYPRIGLIRMTDSDEVLVSLRTSMN